ncbi:MAG: hypothetical protein SGPRY_006152 [Prymnesium sp.]
MPSTLNETCKTEWISSEIYEKANKYITEFDNKTLHMKSEDENTLCMYFISHSQMVTEEKHEKKTSPRLVRQFQATLASNVPRGTSISNWQRIVKKCFALAKVYVAPDPVRQVLECKANPLNLSYMGKRADAQIADGGTQEVVCSETTILTLTKKTNPSQYIDSHTALLAIAVSLLLLHPPKLSSALVTKAAVGCGAWYVAGQFGFQADGAALVATLLVARALMRAFQLILTLMATFPLTISFPFVVNLIPRFSIKEADFFSADGASPETAQRRRSALEQLQKRWAAKYPQCLRFGSSLKTLISDVRFTSGRCFPPFNEVTNKFLDPSMALAKTNGPCVVDIDKNESLDISGSYGVNVCGYEAYKKFITKGWEAAKDKGLYLGSLDETTLENIQMIRSVSGLDEVSFHMSGTEAVMAAVRCARFNKKRRLVVTFGGAYHGWWDGMQPAAGNERTPDDVLCLKDMNNLSLAVIRARASEIAAVLVNPLQCFHLNSSPPSDLVLSTNNRKVIPPAAGCQWFAGLCFLHSLRGAHTLQYHLTYVGPKPGYKEWLHKLRAACTESGVLLIFDEVYTGFRIHPKGAQGAYDVKADIVTYGKTLGGGLPVGVCCGNKEAMTRADPKKAARVAYVIGTFAGHPAVMGSMNAFLKCKRRVGSMRLKLTRFSGHARPETISEYDAMHTNIEEFVAKANAAFKSHGYPIELANWFSVWSMMYTQPGRYHWMLQYYMRDAGVALSWVGTGRLLFSLDWTEAHYADLLTRMLAACEEMRRGGWWEPPAINVKKAVGLEFAVAIVKSLFGF